MSVVDGGRPTGVSYSGSHFPLVDPSADVRGLLADFYVAHRDGGFALPFRLASVTGLTQPPVAPTGRPSEVVVVDADGATVFDSTAAADYAIRLWGRFTIHEWVGERAVCRAVQHNSGPEADGTYPGSFAPERAVLDERCVEQWPRSLEAVVVNGQTLTGAVELLNGYNCDLRLLERVVAPGRAFRNRAQLTLSPGGGQGLYPGCEDQLPVLRRINQVGPDPYGNFLLAAADCYWLSRDGQAGLGGGFTFAQYLDHGVRLNNDCLPCCSCDDFVNTYRGIRRLYDAFRELGGRANAARDQYVANRDRWLAEKDRRAASPIRVSMLPFRPGAVQVGVGYCNGTGGCLGSVELKMTFTTSGPAGEADKPTSVWYPTDGCRPELGTLAGTYPEYRMKWEPVDTGRTAKAKFQAYFPGATAADWAKLEVKAYVNGEAAPSAADDITRTFLV